MVYKNAVASLTIQWFSISNHAHDFCLFSRDSPSYLDVSLSLLFHKIFVFFSLLVSREPEVGDQEKKEKSKSFRKYFVGQPHFLTIQYITVQPYI